MQLLQNSDYPGHYCVHKETHKLPLEVAEKEIYLIRAVCKNEVW